MKRTPFKRQTKPRKCKGCNGPMPPDARAGATACGVECAAVLGADASAKAARKQAKIDRASDAAKREAQKTLPQLKKELQAAFNKFIRARDFGLPCISCGKSFTSGEKFDAGHYRSVGSAHNTRYVENNVHSQCVYCNQHLKGNTIPYRINLIKKIGLAAVEAIESDNAIRKFTREELTRMIAEYRQKTKDIKNEQDHF